MDMSDGLTEAIGDLYRTFAKYRRPQWFVGCSCCWGPGEPIEGPGIHGRIRVVAPGADRPLNELEVSELSELADQVPHLGGDVDVLRHYLPRVFELLVTTGFDWPDFEPVVARLNFGADLGGIPWSRWPLDEQRSVNSFFEAVWTQRLKEPMVSPPNSADTLLCGFGLAVFDITPYLGKWLAFDEPYSARHFAEFLGYNDGLSRGRLSNAFWTSYPFGAANLRRVVRFLTAASTATAILNAIQQVDSFEERTALEESFDRLPGNDAFAATALETAVESDDQTLVDALLKKGANPNEVDRVTNEPIWQIAYRSARFERVSDLSKNGADLNHADKDGKTFLHRLVGLDPSEAEIRRFLSMGASSNVADRNGWTPLHTASQYGFLASMAALLKAGAEPLATANGRSCLDVAKANFRVEAIELLERHGHSRR